MDSQPTVESSPIRGTFSLTQFILSGDIIWISGVGPHLILAASVYICPLHQYPLFSFSCPPGAQEPLPVLFEAFPTLQHQYTLPHPSSFIVTEDVVPASEIASKNVNVINSPATGSLTSSTRRPGLPKHTVWFVRSAAAHKYCPTQGIQPGFTLFPVSYGRSALSQARTALTLQKCYQNK